MGRKPYTLGTKCYKGHLLTEENTYDEGTRIRCRTCYNVRHGFPEDHTPSKVSKLILGGVCSRGHLLTEKNLYIYPTGKLACKTCRRMSFRKSQGIPPADPNEPVENWTRDSNRKKTHCRRGHPFDEDNTRITPDGSQQCKICSYTSNRAKQYQEKYGITLEDYENMEQQQGGTCAICGEIPNHTLHVDHDHETGKVRELLCSNCNTSLGGFKDNPDLLIAAANYIIKHKQ